MKFLFIYVAFMSVLLMPLSAYSGQLVVNISIKTAFHSKYNHWLERRNCHQIKQYNSPFAHRVTVELILICKALKLGGLNAWLNIIPYPSMGRTMKEAKIGAVDIVGESRALSTISSSDFFISEAVIKNGDIRLGIFGLAENTALFKVKNVQDLRKFTAISSKKWPIDWKTLEHLQLKKIDSIGDISKMHMMIEKKRGDYILDAFSANNSETLNMHGVELKAIPNLLIGLKTSRHFVVPKRSAKAKRVFAALEKGLRILSARKEIMRAYTESGFINENTKAWTVLN